ncbi:FtsB family cell division protein [Nocardia alni]|uniref:FtsB family cell division protein n=1 Tax=Nocardia alni TaxID=2815723 RepID=UPI001C23FB3F|nr:septum formation initiator family protein [Nocardia alni]
MIERRGTGPGGRGDRRTARSARARPDGAAASPSAREPRAAREGAEHERAAAGARPAFESGGPESAAAPRRSRARTSRASASKTERNRREHKILGLSTGRAVVLAAVLCALALTLAVPMRTYLSQRAESSQLSQQRRELETQVSQLRDRRAQQQDPNYIKTEARDRLRLVMPGDTAYIVQVPGIEQPAVPTPAPAPRKPDPWYTELWRSMNTPQPVPAAAPEPRSSQTPHPPAPTPEGQHR